MKRIWIPQSISAVMLLWALNPENPYGYYILLRWVCCAAFAYVALKALAQGKEGWVWVLGVTAVVYNPILRIHLTREIWSVINVVTILVGASSIVVLKSGADGRKAGDKTIQTHREGLPRPGGQQKEVSCTGERQGCQILGTGPRHHCSN